MFANETTALNHNVKINLFRNRVTRPVALALLSLAMLMGMAGLLPTPARADVTTYSSTKRQYKVGILLIDSTIVPGQEARGPENPDPYVFYIADAREDIKPQGWEFVNPLAPGVVTAEVRDRWLARDPNNPYQLGQKVTKQMAAYWEVSLSNATVQNLLQYDLLFIHNHRPTGFTPADREKLRKVVDAGGIVWIENCGGMFIEPTRPFFLDELQLRSAGGNGGPVINEPNHPILNTPYRLTIDEVANIGDKNYSGYVLSTIDYGNLANLAGINRAPNPEVLVNIVGNSVALDSNGTALPYVAAGNYGAGAVIASSGDSGCDINDYCGGTNAGSGGNSGAYAGERLEAAHIEDLKFLYNLVAWGSANNTERRNNRRTATSFEAVGAPVLTSFNFDNEFTRALRPGDIVNSASSPVIAKDVVFISGVDTQSGALTIRCYDANPFSDLDGDGNIDEGIPDISLGLPYDEVWRWSGGAAGNLQPSSPVYASVLLAQGSQAREDRIFVALPDGSLVILSAFGATGGGSLLPTPAVRAVIPGGGGTYQNPTGVAPAPVFFENRLYQVLPNGLVRCVDAISGAVLFVSFQSAPNITIQPLASPTLGFVRQSSEAVAEGGRRGRQAATFAQNSNETTNDLMLYVPAIVTDANGTVSQRVFAYWLGTRNEVQRQWAPGTSPTANSGIIATRVGGGPGGPGQGWYATAIGGLTRDAGGPFLTPRVRVYSELRDNNGDVLLTASERYARGEVSPDYAAAPAGITEDGRVEIIKINNAARDLSRSTDILVAFDYDVLYLPADVNFTPPAQYAANPTGVGARPNALLNIPFAFGNLLSSPALTPDDLLTFGVVQQWNSGSATGTAGPAFSSVQAITEQEGDTSGSTSRLRWRYSIFNDFTATAAPGDLFFSQEVDNVTVTDVVPLTNYLVFDPAWPQSDVAVRQTAPEALRQVTVLGSPVVTNNGITYVLARAVSVYNNGPVTLLMAFRSNPEIVLRLPEPFDESRGVTVSQANLLSDPNNLQVLASPGSKNPGAPVVMDGGQGRIRINNSRVGNGGFSASQSFVVRYTPFGSQDERRVVVSPVPLAAGDPGNLPVDSTGQLTLNTGGYTPLLWYYVLPGVPGANTSPTLIGDYIYWSGIANGAAHIFAVDARPQDNDPTVRIGFGEQVLKVVATLSGSAAQTNHVRMAQRISTGGTPIGGNLPPVVGAQGTLVVNTSAGTFAYEQGITLIAESKRVLEATGDGSAQWSMDATVRRIVGGGQEPLFGIDPANPGGGVVLLNPPATGVAQITRQTLAKPTTARRIASSDYLISDTGNNRVVRTDRSGEVKWELNRFTDPYGILESGEPLTLNSPTDVQFYTAPSLDGGGNVVGYEIHYLIADAGNFRIIEVADYFDRNGQPLPPPGGQQGDHALVWTTRSSSQGKRYRYQSVQRFLGRGPAGSAAASLFGYPYVTAIVSNTNVGTTGGETVSDFTGGSIVQVKYAPVNTAITLTDGTAQTPTYLWTPGNPEPIGNGTVNYSIEKVRLIAADGSIREKRLSGPVFFEQLNLPSQGGTSRTLFLICDAEGAYVVESRPVGGTVENDVLWQFTQRDYNLINGVAGSQVLANGRLNFPGVTAGTPLSQQLLNQLPRFQPTSMQLLPSGNYLITNGATGRSSFFANGQFNGEVLEIDPAGFSVLVNAPFGPTRQGGTFANFSVPRLLRGNSGTGLNSQEMGNPTSNTGLLEQPLSAYRP
ncbi:MAG: hypothetical protein OHK0029_18680 [Armatimonadaceae bacterium]